jgi:5'-nucleotidase
VVQVLLTNDDGIDAPGLKAFEQVLASLATVVVVAPDRHLSGCGHQTTVDRPLTMTEVAPRRFAVDGTPADCVRVGLQHTAPDVDWVFSGINDGGNLGVDTFMSGTVAAAREAAFWGRPAIAFSQYRDRNSEFGWLSCMPLVEKALHWVWSQSWEAGVYWNVNLPDTSSEEAVADTLPDLAVCGVDPHPLDVAYAVDGNRYTFQGRYQRRKRLPGFDVQRCFSGDITVSRLQITDATLREDI